MWSCSTSESQTDASARVEAERALLVEKDRSQSYLARIEQLAYTDPLTGIANRRRVEESVDTAAWEARLSGQALALMFVDLNGFKAINDQLGHGAGDELLILTAQRLQRRLRHSDILGRYGGDEFLIALTGLEPAAARAHAETVAEELAAAVAAPTELRGQPRRGDRQRWHRAMPARRRGLRRTHAPRRPRDV